jgi:hypothetical protein
MATWIWNSQSRLRPLTAKAKSFAGAPMDEKLKSLF